MSAHQTGVFVLIAEGHVVLQFSSPEMVAHHQKLIEDEGVGAHVRTRFEDGRYALLAPATARSIAQCLVAAADRLEATRAMIKDAVDGKADA